MKRLYDDYTKYPLIKVKVITLAEAFALYPSKKMIRFINDKQKHKMGIYDDEIYYIILPNEPVGGEKEEVEVWQSNNNGRDIKVKNITLADVFSR